MNFNFYASPRNGKTAYQSGNARRRSPTRENERKGSDHFEIKEDKILETRVNAILEKYKDNIPVKIEIQDKISMFVMNVSIARNVRSKSSEKKLRKEFNQYLNTL